MNEVMILYIILIVSGTLFICYMLVEICTPDKWKFKKYPAKVNGKRYTYYTVIPHKEKPLICPN